MSNKSNILSPVLFSQCLYCIRKNKKKDTYTCESCSARADFALASEGNKAAQRRYAEFKYENLGQKKEPPAPVLQPVSRRPRREGEIGRQGRQPATKEHYENYFDTLGMSVNKKHGKEFKTMKEVLTWLYETFKSQKYIAENELYISAFTVHCMLKCYGIKRLSSKEVGQLWYGKKKGG
jgi:hypothetical protein